MRRAGCLGTLVALSLLAVSGLSAQAGGRRLYIQAVDAATALPVSDLGPADIQVKEDGVVQAVMKVALSNHPMRIVLLVDSTDTSHYEIPDLRAALNAFIDAVPLPHEVALVSTGQQVRVRVQPTTDRKKLKDAAGSFFYDGHGGGTLQFDALLEVDDRFLKKAVDFSPVVVIVTGDGREASQHYDEKAFNQVSNALALRGVSVHAVAFSRGAIQWPAAMAQHLAEVTRGHLELVPVSTTLPERLRALANEIVDNDRDLATWYEVDYVSESKSPKPVIEVSMSRQGVRMRPFPVRHLP